ncbi:acyltransferase family protein [Streptacidiphilus sp. 4-A2]|nr:acyltransferase family protein [Streptacidiphilus sp. 4-A2]
MTSAREQAADEAKVIPISGRRAGGRARGGAQRAARAAGAGGDAVTVPLPSPVAGDAPQAAEADAGTDRDPDRGTDRGTGTGATRAGTGAGQGVAEALAGAVGSALAGPLGGLAERALGKGWERRAADGLGFLRRRLTGDYPVDEFGFDPELTEKVLLTALRPVAEKYFRLEVRGAEHLPTEGGALVVANHSGVLPWDAVMTQVAIHDHTPTQRHLRMLAADLVFVLPGFNELARKAGHTLACSEDAQRLLELGEIVGVWPEGFKGIGKPFAERYKLQRFGRGGFVSSALKAGVPIIPCSIMGAEETYPMIGNARTVARLLGLPYVPVTPTFPWLGPLGVLPLPTKWTIQFGEPIPTDGYPPEAADDPMLVFNLTDQVRETVQHTLYRLLVQRRSVFF